MRFWAKQIPWNALRGAKHWPFYRPSRQGGFTLVDHQIWSQYGLRYYCRIPFLAPTCFTRKMRHDKCTGLMHCFSGALPLNFIQDTFNEFYDGGKTQSTLYLFALPTLPSRCWYNGFMAWMLWNVLEVISIFIIYLLLMFIFCCKFALSVYACLKISTFLFSNVFNWPHHHGISDKLFQMSAPEQPSPQTASQARWFEYCLQRRLHPDLIPRFNPNDVVGVNTELHGNRFSAIERTQEANVYSLAFRKMN